MNGLQPDFVLLNPEHGIIVIEVKDWKDDTLDIRSLGKAIRTAAHRKTEITDLYCPSLGRTHRRSVASILVFPFLTAEGLRLVRREIPGMNYNSAEFITAETEPQNLVHKILDSLHPRVDSKITEAADDLRHWLIEPRFRKDQRQPLKLDDYARSLIIGKGSKSKRRRIKGTAGSGKSQIIAARASEMARRGKRVLVLSYNVTLLNCLKDIAVRWPDPSLPSRDIRDNVVWLNFHQWAKRICKTSNAALTYSGFWKDGHDTDLVLNQLIPDLTKEVLEGGHPESGAYDAVLIDEGQDFMAHWLHTATLAIRPDNDDHPDESKLGRPKPPSKPGGAGKRTTGSGELMIALDLTQDIYNRGSKWSEDLLEGIGFKGRWNFLDVSYRMPREVTALAARFADDYLGESKVHRPEPPSTSVLALEQKPPVLSWIQLNPDTDPSHLPETLVEVMWDQLPSVEDLAVAELVFLTSNHQLGLGVVSVLQNKGVKVQHTFDKNSKPSLAQRMGFWKGGARVKGTTIHSFKGWGSRSLVIHIDSGFDEHARKLAYCALTRLQSDTDCALTVICECPKLGSYGQTWPAFELRN